MYPKYKKSIASGLIVRFTGISTGSVVKEGESSYSIGHTSSSWAKHTNNIWEDYTLSPEDQPNPSKLSLYDSILIDNTRYTKVPNGYVMTSHSGHQLFIKDTLKETL